MLQANWQLKCAEFEIKIVFKTKNIFLILWNKFKCEKFFTSKTCINYFLVFCTYRKISFWSTMMWKLLSTETKTVRKNQSCQFKLQRIKRVFFQITINSVRFEMEKEKFKFYFCKRFHCILKLTKAYTNHIEKNYYFDFIAWNRRKTEFLCAINAKKANVSIFLSFWAGEFIIYRILTGKSPQTHTLTFPHTAIFDSFILVRCEKIKKI